jgi:hypothetical protein
MFEDWSPITIRDKETPVQIQRRMAAVGDVVYCTPGYAAPLTLYDAARGRVIEQHAHTGGAMEFVYDRGVLFVVTGGQSDVSPALTDAQRN